MLGTLAMNDEHTAKAPVQLPAANLHQSDEGAAPCPTCLDTGIYTEPIPNRPGVHRQIPCPTCGREAFAVERLCKEMERG